MMVPLVQKSEFENGENSLIRTRDGQTTSYLYKKTGPSASQ